MAENSSSAQTPAQSATNIRGPLVWLDMDQKELDDAYDQSVYAPNQQLVAGRRRLASETLLKRITPERIAYGPSKDEQLDIYRTHASKRADQYLRSRRGLAPWSSQRIRLSGGNVYERGGEFRRARFRASRERRRQPDADGATSPQRRRMGLQKCRARRRRRGAHLHHRPFFRRASLRLRPGHRLAERFWPAG